MRLLDVVRPALNFLPEVESPLKRPEFNDKILWTAWSVFIYLVIANIPLFGIQRVPKSLDDNEWIRTIMGANRGTILELGMTPIITAGIILQFMASQSGDRGVSIEMNCKEDRELFQSLQKCMGMFIGFVVGALCVASGMYGNIAELGLPVCALIVAQLVAAQFMVTMLDELLSKGYGLGAGVPLFMAINICSQFLMAGFSPEHINVGEGKDNFEYEGAIFALFHNLFSKTNKPAGVLSALARLSGPNVYRLAVTIALVFAMIYVQQYRVEIKLSSRKMRGFSQPYPIKMIYASNICLICYTILVANIYFLSQILSSFAATYALDMTVVRMLIGLVGKWGSDNNFNKAPTGGLAYYVTPQFGIINALCDPIGTVFYVCLLMYICVQVSKQWIDISGNNSRDVAKQFSQQELCIEGNREDAMMKVLKLYIPPAAALGGAVLAGMCIAGDVVGVCGSGVGVILAVTICYQYFEEFAREQQRDPRMQQAMRGN